MTAPVCPGCGEPAENYPPSMEVDDGLDPPAWWCMDCLDDRVRLARLGLNLSPKTEQP